MKFDDPWRLGPYLLLAVFMVVLAVLYTHSFYGCKHWFDRLPIPKHFRPAIGRVPDGRVAWSSTTSCWAGIHRCWPCWPSAIGHSGCHDAPAAGGLTTAAILLAIALGKILTTSLTIGSGGSGGVFGPSMVIGGCGGGALGIVLHHFWPWLVPHPASFVIVGMAGFFAAAAKTPFSTLIMVSEMTGGYQLLLPSLWVCTPLVSFLSDKQSIYSSQVESRSLSPAHQGSYVRQVLAQSPREPVSPCRTKQRASRRHVGPFASPARPAGHGHRTPGHVAHTALPVVDADNRLLGIVTLDEVYLASQSPSLQALVLAADLMRGDVQPLTPEDTLDRALELFVENDLHDRARRDEPHRPLPAGHGEPVRHLQRLSAARPRSGRAVGPACRAKRTHHAPS